MKRVAHLKPLSTDEVLKEVTKIIARYFPESRIFLFGSRAKGEIRDSADFDIAIDAGTKIPLDIMARIKAKLEELPTLKSIDIIDLNRVGAKFKMIVATTGVNIYDRGKNTA